MNRSEELSEIIANTFLDKYGIQGFIGASIETLLTINGNILIYKNVKDANFYGFSAKGKGNSFIVLNTYHNLRLRYYTCAHEIWHILKEKENFYLEGIDEERAADHFSASLMLPENAVIEMYNNIKKQDANQFMILFVIADASHMPYQAVARRFSELKLKRNEINQFISTTKNEFRLLEEKNMNEDEYVEKEFLKMRSKIGLPPSEYDKSDSINSFPAYEKILDQNNM